MHFIPVMIRYCCTVLAREEDKLYSKSKPSLALLILYPMGQVSLIVHGKQMSEEEPPSIRNHIYSSSKRCFIFMILDFDTLSLCFVAENTSTNYNMSKLTGKPRASCNSYALNLEFNHICDRNTDLGNTTSLVNDTMRSAKTLKKRCGNPQPNGVPQ